MREYKNTQKGEKHMFKKLDGMLVRKKIDNRLSDRDCTDGIFRNLSNRRRDDTA